MNQKIQTDVIYKSRSRLNLASLLAISIPCTILSLATDNDAPPVGVFRTGGVITNNIDPVITSNDYRLNRVTENHLARIRGAGGDVANRGAVISGGADVSGKGTYGKETVVAPGVYQSERSANLWTTFSYDWTEFEGFYPGSDYDGQEATLTVGLDFPVSDNFTLGVLVDGSRGDFDFPSGSGDSESWRVAAYGTVGESTGLYVNFLVGYGDQDHNFNRRLGGALTGFNAISDINSDSIQALATVGYTMETGSLRHGPFLGVEYQRIDVDNFVQTGGPIPIGVTGFEAESARGLLGYRVDTTSGPFTPYASVAYAHEFEDDGYATTASLPNGTPFAVFGGAQQSAVLISIGTGIEITPSLDLNVGYQGEIRTGGSGVESHGAAIGLNLRF